MSVIEYDDTDEQVISSGWMTAIAISREADALEVLLDSVYTETPTLCLVGLTPLRKRHSLAFKYRLIGS